MKTTTTPSNIITFSNDGYESLDLELDKETVLKLQQLALEKKTSIDLVLEEALDNYLGQIKVMENLLTCAKTLSDTPDSPQRLAAEEWELRLSEELEQLIAL